MPKDSPCSDGRAQHVGPRQSGGDLLVTQHTQPAHPVRLGMPAPLDLARRAVARHPQDRRPLDPLERIEEHVQSLALLVAPEEQDGRVPGLGAYGLGRLEASHVDAVEQHLEGAAAGAQARLARRLRDRHPDLHPPAHQPPPAA